MDLALNNLQWLMCHKTKPNLYICMELNNGVKSDNIEKKLIEK